MAAENTIVLITNDNNVAQILKPQLILLRGIDTISVAKYSEAIENIKESMPDTIILHCGDEKDECIKLIKDIRSDKAIKNITILLIVNKYDQDLILNAYDEDITDFLTLKNDDAEILMRTIWCLKKNTLINTNKKQYDLLQELNVINPETGFYTSQYCEKVFNNEFKTIQKKKSDGILISVSPSEESKTRLNAGQLASAIKNSTRNSDVVAHGPANKFYILLSQTSLKGAYCVWDKIKKAVGEEHSIIAGLSEVGCKRFEELKNELLKALIEAESTKTDLVVASQEEKKSSEDWLNKISTNQKNFKLFKQAFNKKLDKVIAPVFFQMQKMYEEKLYKTKIEQSSNSTISSFLLKSDKNESELKITYPGFSKINIDIIHQGLDSPENKRISLNLADFDESCLTKIIENFIKEFKIPKNS